MCGPRWIIVLRIPPIHKGLVVVRQLNIISSLSLLVTCCWVSRFLQSVVVYVPLWLLLGIIISLSLWLLAVLAACLFLTLWLIDCPSVGLALAILKLLFFSCRGGRWLLLKLGLGRGSIQFSIRRLFLIRLMSLLLIENGLFGLFWAGLIACLFSKLRLLSVVEFLVFILVPLWVDLSVAVRLRIICLVSLFWRTKINYNPHLDIILISRLPFLSDGWRGVSKLLGRRAIILWLARNKISFVSFASIFIVASISTFCLLSRTFLKI